MNYVLIETNNGYEQIPIEKKISYMGMECTAEMLTPFQWNQVEGKNVFYIAGEPEFFEYDDVFSIGSEEADIRIDDWKGIAVVEGDLLCFYGEGEERFVYHNGKKLSVKDTAVKVNLQYGDQLLIGSVYLLYYEKYVQIYASEEQIECSLMRCEAKEIPFEGFPKYTKSPRLIMRLPDKEISIAKPPTEVKMQKSSLVQIVISPLIMLGITIAMAILMKRGIFVLASAASTVMTIIFSVVRFINERKDCREKTEIRNKLYEDYLLRKRKELFQAHQKEIDAWNYNFPSVKQIEQMIHRYSNRIYEKSLDDEDFLTFSIGVGRSQVNYPIQYEYDELQIEKDELDERAFKIKEKFEYMDEKPISVDLKRAHIGLVGEKSIVHEQIKLMVAQLTFQQSYHDLQIILIHDKKYDEEFSWMTWYPHLKIKALNLSGNINSEQMRDQVLGSVLQILKDRKIKIEESNKSSRFVPHFLFIIDEPKLIIDHSIMEYLGKEGDNLGFSIVFTSHMQGNLPENIGTIIEFKDSKEGKLILNQNEVVNKEFQLNHVDDCDLEWMARNLSVLEHSQGVISNIPESITFFDMYKVKTPEELNSGERWKKNQSHKSLAVPLGVRAENDIVSLNLHEKAHGPHGLVAGTTGSGKSEIIQSYILSLAVNFHPYEVGFLLIDYKGGGMAGLFKDLPHLLGTITNLDGSESQRAMASIKSELARRQRIFSHYNVNHINAYNKLFKNGEAQEPIPHLFLISDEFAELKKEQPDFMNELVSTARIGRSLGIHLILATQKPSGVVNDQIWTNSKFKLALKVQDESDSREIIKTPDAAYITQAGRAYLQVGNNEIYELFQSAWSGAEYSTDGEKRSKDNRVYLINDLGQGELLNEDLSSEEDSNEVKETQLDVTIDYLGKIFEMEGVEKVKKPWLPPLPEKLHSPIGKYIENTQWLLPAEYQKSKMPVLNVPLGMVDIPEEQMQIEYEIDLEKDGNIIFLASAGFGKTVFLMTAVLSLAMTNQVEELNFYVLDFGNSGLIPLNGLPHTADYITYDDNEKLSKFIHIIQEEMSTRKKLFAQKMVQNFNVYNRTNEEHLKAIVIVVDNFDVVRELGLDAENFFTKISRDGASLGIYLIVTATRSNGVKYSILNNFKTKIAGVTFEQSEINSTVGRSAYRLPEIKGRAMVKVQNVNIMQIYTMVNFEDDIEYNRNIKQLIEAISKKYPNRKASRIPILPETFVYPMMRDYETVDRPMDIAVGLEVENVRKTGFLRVQSPFVIIGESGKGKTNALKVILNQIHEKAYVFDSATPSLFAYKNQDNIAYIQAESEIEKFIEEMRQLCQERKEALKAAINQDATISASDFYKKQKANYIIIDDVDYFLGMTNKYEKEIAGVLMEAAECGIGVIATVHAAKLKGYDAVSKWFKSATYGLVLSAQGILNIFPVRTQREYPPMGQGLLFNNGVYEKVLLPECK